MLPRSRPRLPPQPPTLADSCQRRASRIEQVQAPPVEFHSYARAHADIRESGNARDQWLASRVHVHQRFAAERLDDQHIDIANAFVDRAEPDELRTDAELELSFIRRQVNRDHQAASFNHPSRFARPSSPSL